MSKKIALVAHDSQKENLVNFVKNHEDFFSQFSLVATGTTGMRIMNKTDLKITRLQSGPLGGDQQIGALIAQDDLELIIFLRDPLTAQPHEPDVSALVRLCDVHNIPLATNIRTAEYLIEGFKLDFFKFQSN